jgi:hypothetical protein
MKYVIVRTRYAGVFAGFLKSKTESVAGIEATLQKVRRIWYWEGAASLSQLAVEGTCKPEKCKFPIEVPEVDLPEVIEILYATDKAKDSIAKVPIWQIK